MLCFLKSHRGDIENNFKIKEFEFIYDEFEWKNKTPNSSLKPYLMGFDFENYTLEDARKFMDNIEENIEKIKKNFPND